MSSDIGSHENWNIRITFGILEFLTLFLVISVKKNVRILIIYTIWKNWNLQGPRFGND